MDELREQIKIKQKSYTLVDKIKLIEMFIAEPSIAECCYKVGLMSGSKGQDFKDVLDVKS